MHKPKSKLRERTQLVFIYTLMILAIVSMLTVLVLIVQGYRYNRFDNRIEQGGLVQFNSRPSGASVSVDDIQLANRTASKITLTAGEHTVKFTRDNFMSWEKTATVKPGGVLWLNYALLFPTSPKVTNAAVFDQVSSAITSPNRNWTALVANPTVPTIHLVRLDSDTPVVTTVPISPQHFTVPVDPTSQRFAVESWDKDSESVIVRHTYDDKREYLAVDLRGGSDIYNITTQLGVDVTQVSYSRGDSNVLYLLTTNKELRRATVSSSSLSGPLATNVSGFSAADERAIAFETYADATGKRTVGYVSAGVNKSKVLASYELGNDVVLQARVGMYYGDRFLTVARGTNLDIMKGDLPQSDSNTTLALETVARLTLPAAAPTLGFSPGDNRMVYAQGETVVATYDLELGMRSTITLPTASARSVDWLDGFNVATTAGGAAQYYDYDGTNMRSIAASVLDLPVALSSNDKFMYYFAQGSDGVTLLRVQMTD